MTIDLERQWLSMVKEQAVDSANRLRRSGRASSDPYLRGIIRRASESINQRAAAAMLSPRGGQMGESGVYILQILESIALPELSHLVVIGAVNHLLTSKRPDASLAALGAALIRVVEAEMRLRFISEVCPDIDKALRQKNKNATFLHKNKAIMTRVSGAVGKLPKFFMDPETKTRAGLALVELLLLAGSMFVVTKVHHGGGKYPIRCVELSLEVMRLFNKTLSIDDLAPIAPPLGLYLEPLPASREEFKGWLSPRKPLIKANWLSGRISTPEVTTYIPNNVVTHLNSVAYRVNTEMLEWLKVHEQKLGRLGVLPELELRLPSNKSQHGQVYKEWFKNEPARRIYFRIKAQANLMAKYQYFYHDWFMDFRGRLYTTNGLLSPQGRPVSKALIMFAASTRFKLGSSAATEWFTYGARLAYGDYSPPLQDGSKLAPLVEMAVHGALQPEMLDKPKNYLLFVAWALDTQKLFKHGKLETSIPIRRDATASSLQHMAAMTADPQMMGMVNLVRVPISGPVDVYTHLQSYAPELSRDRIKQFVMTLSYNSTTYGRSVQVQKEVGGNLANIMQDDRDLSTRMAAILKPVLNVRDALVEEGRATDWVIKGPSGVVFDAKCWKLDGKRYWVRYNDHRFLVRYKSKTPKELNIRKTISGFVANYIHARDAAMLHMALPHVPGPVFSIHDCVGTLPGYMDDTCKELANCFFSMYAEKLSWDITPWVNNSWELMFR